MNDREFRLECLRFAMQENCFGPENRLDIAEKYFEYCRHGKVCDAREVLEKFYNKD